MLWMKILNQFDIKMVIITKDKWWIIYQMDSERKSTKMKVDMKGLLRMAKEMVLEGCFSKIKNFSLDSGKMIKSTEREFIYIKITKNSKEVSKTIKNKAMVYTHTRIWLFIKEIINKIKDTEKESEFWRINKYGISCGKMANCCSRKLIRVNLWKFSLRKKWRTIKGI